MFKRWPCQRKMRFFLRLAKIRPGKQLWRKDYLRALRRCLTNEVGDGVDIFYFTSRQWQL